MIILVLKWLFYRTSIRHITALLLVMCVFVSYQGYFEVKCKRRYENVPQILSDVPVIPLVHMCQRVTVVLVCACVRACVRVCVYT